MKVKSPANFYGGERAQNGVLSFGFCDVSIPKLHKIGELETPSIWKVEFREDLRRHIVLRKVIQQTPDKFYEELSSCVSRSANKEAFVFIHGYNVTFRDAARRTAQLAYDLAFAGAPILYSWPSQGTWSSYPADEATVEWSAPHLKSFLEEVAARSQANTIHLIAHSMGNRALTKALEAIAQKPRQPIFHQVVLTAPDIDAGVFMQLAQMVKRTARHVTLYMSSADKALAASKKFHQYPRAGESDENIVIIDGIDTINVSSVKTDFLGHSYYASNKTVVSDLFWLLRGHTLPSQRFGMTIRKRGDLVYWSFRP